ncbi:MAG: sulfotransferase [Kiritimatiellia bacterium]
MSPPPPFFILGCPRSGTTLLQVLVDSHPDIAIPPESFLFDRFGPLLVSYGNLAEPAALRRLASDLLADERIRDWKLAAGPDDLLSQIKESSAAGLFAALFLLYAEKQGKTRWGDKTPQHALRISELLAVFPAARIIHLVRDGRDVAESTARIAIGPCSILAIARRWKLYLNTVREAAGRLPPAQFLEVRFEDMVRDPAGLRRRILAFIGEDDSRCPPIGDEVPKTETRERSSAYAHHASLNKAISAGKIGVYKSAFTARQVELFESVAGPELAAHGYALENRSPRPPTRAEELSAFGYDHSVRYLRKFTQPGAARQIAKELRLVLQQATRTIFRSGP